MMMGDRGGYLTGLHIPAPVSEGFETHKTSRSVKCVKQDFGHWMHTYNLLSSN